MTRVAGLIDRGFFLKRLPTVCPEVAADDPIAVARTVRKLVERHLSYVAKIVTCKSPWELLYRAFFYDAEPLSSKAHLPISRKAADYAKSPQAVFRCALFAQLRAAPNFAVRLGTTFSERQWILSEKTQKDLIAGRRDWSSVTYADFYPGIRQKAVDMRLGVDIATITLKRQADMLILVAGDSDFVPAAKLARREGVKIILDPLWLNISGGLYEHINGLRSGFRRPGAIDPMNAEADA